MITRTDRWLRRYSVATLLLLFTASQASALILGGTGNDPVRDAGWPRGAKEVANLKTRIAWWEGPPFGGGEWHFEYRGTTAQFQAAVDLFAKVLSPRLELVVHGGEHTSFWISSSDKKADPSVDWEFRVWVPLNWNRLYNHPRSYFSSDQPNFGQPVAAPRLNVYVGGSVDWASVRVPENVVVIDRRLESNGLAADAGGAICGSVWDMASGKPVVGAQVRVGEGPAAAGETDDNGRFTIQRIPSGGHSVTVDAKGYAPKRVGFVSVNGAFYQHYDVMLSAERTLAGRVTDAEGQPLEDVAVRLSSVIGLDGLGYPPGGKSTTQTDAAGQFAFDRLPPGIVRLSCRKSGYHYNSVLNVHDIGDTPLEIRMIRAGTVHVSVTDEEGVPIRSQFIVELEPEGGSRVGSWSGSSNVRPDGTVTFRGVPPGRYHIFGKPNPGRADAKTEVHTVTIVGNDEHQVNLQWK